MPWGSPSGNCALRYQFVLNVGLGAPEWFRIMAYLNILSTLQVANLAVGSIVLRGSGR